MPRACELMVSQLEYIMFLSEEMVEDSYVLPQGHNISEHTVLMPLFGWLPIMHQEVGDPSYSLLYSVIQIKLH